MWQNVLLIVVLAVSVVTDLKERRIYNKLLFPAAAASLALWGAEAGWAGIGSALLGLLAGLAILLIPYLAGGMGAGDVKLLGVVGLCKGAAFVWNAALYMAFAGGLLALAVLLCRRDMLDWLKWAAAVIYSYRYGIRLQIKGAGPSLSVGTPYGVAIAAGAAVSLWFRGWGLA